MSRPTSAIISALTKHAFQPGDSPSPTGATAQTMYVYVPFSSLICEDQLFCMHASGLLPIIGGQRVESMHAKSSDPQELSSFRTLLSP